MRGAARIAVAALVVLARSSEAQQAGMERPDAIGPTRVELSLLVLEVLDINDADETFETDFVLEARWRDPRLVWDRSAAPQTAEQHYTRDDAWHPRLAVVNDKTLATRMPDVLRVAPDGSVTWRQRFKGSLTADLALRSFPMDRQWLPVRVVSGDYPPDQVELVVERERAVLLEPRTAGWRLAMGEPGTGVLDLSTLDRESTQATFVIEAVRESRYFLWTMMLPLTLIVLMAWMVFWIDPTLLPSQVGLSTAAIFSMIAYRTALRLSLPRVSYLTRADVFILGSTLIVFLALAHAVASGHLARNGREALARRMDRVGRWVYLLAFAVVVVLSLAW